MHSSPTSSAKNRTKASSLFREQVYQATKQIPKGSIATYAEIAAAVGRPKSFRAVGNTLNKNHFRSVPCHRVVRSDGMVGGYARGSDAKIQKLSREGIKITRGRINVEKFGKKSPQIKYGQ